ncbi:MAG TPA: hypothetical protein VGR52_01005 [Stellaceae bacterium]|nr:hypothetical protein [Stellaceae bacterium]
MSDAARGDADAAWAHVAAFTAEIPRLKWFAAVGTILAPAVIAAVERYVAALGLAPGPIAPVAGWREAAATAQRPDWSRDWWQAESACEQTLQRQGAARFGLQPLLAALTALAEAAAELQTPSASALAAAGVDAPALAKVAAGAAAQACHQRGLALLAGSETGRAFTAKFELFAAGHWPLGIVGGTCFVF